MEKENKQLERPPAGAEWQMFSAVGCNRTFHQHRIQVEMVTPNSIIDVVFQIAENEGVATHWAWLSDGKIDMIQPTLDLLNMCFPYDPIGKELAGVGLRIPLVLIE